MLHILRMVVGIKLFYGLSKQNKFLNIIQMTTNRSDNTRGVLLFLFINNKHALNNVLNLSSVCRTGLEQPFSFCYLYFNISLRCTFHRKHPVSLFVFPLN